MDPLLCGSAAMSQNDFKTSEIIEPQEASPMKKLSVVGIDIAKQVFHLVGMDEQDTILVRKRLYRAQVMAFIAQLPPTLIGMEACGGAHDWARRFREHGHECGLSHIVADFRQIMWRKFLRSPCKYNTMVQKVLPHNVAWPF
jgi:hypothetical protein